MATKQGALEIQVVPPSGYAATEGSLTENARDAFNALGDVLTDAIEPFRKKVSQAAASADEVEVKLELTLRADGKWVIVSLGGSATVSLKLLWKKVGEA